MIYALVAQEIPKIERVIVRAVDREFRDKVVVRLAQLDQKMAALRDRLGVTN
jgi:hypothetical protein